MGGRRLNEQRVDGGWLEDGRDAWIWMKDEWKMEGRLTEDGWGTDGGWVKD